MKGENPLAIVASWVSLAIALVLIRDHLAFVLGLVVGAAAVGVLGWVAAVSWRHRVDRQRRQVIRHAADRDRSASELAEWYMTPDGDVVDAAGSKVP